MLEALGANIMLNPQQVAASIESVGLGFMFAPSHHLAMKYAGPVRKELGVRTIFNILGPLTNPAGVTRQVLGVWGSDVQPLVAAALAELGAEHALVVHSDDGRHR